MLGRYGVRRVGESRGSLVGGNHEIGIVVLVPHDRLGRHDLVAVEIVGDVEEARDEDAVGGEPLRRDRLAVSRRQPFRHEAALGADRNDHRVLDLLRLGEAEDLGAEVLRPVGPADAAARHLAEAKMDAVDARAVHENFAVRTRRRQAFDGAAVELDRDFPMRRAVLAELEEVGAHDGRNDIGETADDAVLVETRVPPPPRRRSCQPFHGRAVDPRVGKRA